MREMFFTILGAGGGVDLFSILGVLAFLVVSFLSQKAQKAAKEAKEKEERNLGSADDDLPLEEKESFSPEGSKMESWEKELRKMLGDVPEEVPSASDPEQVYERTLDEGVAEVPLAPRAQERIRRDRGEFALKRESQVLKVARTAQGREVKEAARQIKTEAREVQRSSEQTGTPYVPLRKTGLVPKALPVPVSGEPGNELGQKLRSVENLRDYIVVASILGKPKALTSPGEEVDRVI